MQRSFFSFSLLFLITACGAAGRSASTAKDASAPQATLSCATARQADDLTPAFTLTAQVDAAYATGAELTALRNVSVASVASRTLDVVAKDDSYRPRTNPNRNRFNFDLDAADDQFDGIIHGVILPKVLDVSAASFKAYVASSTDSYHDGIISYFPMTCSL